MEKENINKGLWWLPSLGRVIHRGYAAKERKKDGSKTIDVEYGNEEELPKLLQRQNYNEGNLVKEEEEKDRAYLQE